MRVSLKEKFKLYTKLDLTLFLKEDKSIKCEGSVVWIMETPNPEENLPAMVSTGIMFTSISEEDREYIRNLVERLLANKEEGKQDTTSTQ